MEYLVPGYIHRNGAHCGSASMKNMLGFRGIELSEPMCFGLGSGAGFLYVDNLPVPPFAAFHGRIMEMERELCDALAVPFPEREEPDAESGWVKAREAVSAGNPVLVNTDLAFLDYFDTRTHFSGHRVVLFGFDDESGEAILSDSEREEPQRVRVESLKRARSSNIPPYPMGNRWCVIAPASAPRTLSEAIPGALKKNAAMMLKPREGEDSGVAGIRKAAKEVVKWPSKVENWKFAVRFGYQVIEKRGTGGGFFRRLYARYLEEASATHPRIAGSGLPAAMTAIADRWTEAAALLKEISESGDPSGLASVSGLFFAQAAEEERFWKEALSVSAAISS